MELAASNAPDARGELLTDVLTWIQQGDVKIPAFQRGFVWKAEQVLSLLDSVYKGYPIGSVLLWRTEPKLAPERNLGGLTLPQTRAKYPTNYVLDGQQRLTSLYGVLTFDGVTEADSPFSVSFDLEKRMFVASGESRPTQIPMGHLLATQRFLEFERGLKEASLDHLVDEADRLWKAFNTYRLAVVTISATEVEDVAEIFERVNSTGTRLTLFDLMVAATWSSDFYLRDEMEATIAELQAKDFRAISPVTILQVLALTRGTSAKRDAILQLRDLSAIDLAQSVERVRGTLKRAVDFLSTELAVKSDDFLPYERQLVVLAFVFSQRSAFDPQQQARLRRWFWRTSLSERYRRGGEGLFDEDLAAVVALLGDTPDLERFGRAPDENAFQKSDFRKGSALTSGFVAMLAAQHPRNLWRGGLLDTGEPLSAYNRKEFHHLFPQGFLRKYPGNPQISPLANMCMLSSEDNKAIGDRAPSVYFRELQQRHTEQFDDVLASNLISSDSVQFLLKDDYAGFLNSRAAHLATVAASLC